MIITCNLMDHFLLEFLNYLKDLGVTFDSNLNLIIMLMTQFSV